RVDLLAGLEIEDVHADLFAEPRRADELVEGRGEGAAIGRDERRGQEHHGGRGEEDCRLGPHGAYASRLSAGRLAWGPLRALLLSALLALAPLVTGCTRAAAGEARDAVSVLVSGDPQNLDPRFVWDAWGLRVSRLIFASLFTIDPVRLEAVPELAESAERVGEREWLVRLREGLAFSDGSPLDAEDVVATFRGVVDPALGSRFAGTYGRIERVEAVDPRTVRFVLREPHATFLTDLELPIVRRVDATRPMRE